MRFSGSLPASKRRYTRRLGLGWGVSAERCGGLMDVRHRRSWPFATISHRLPTARRAQPCGIVTASGRLAVLASAT